MAITITIIIFFAAVIAFLVIGVQKNKGKSLETIDAEDVVNEAETVIKSKLDSIEAKIDDEIKTVKTKVSAGVQTVENEIVAEVKKVKKKVTKK